MAVIGISGSYGGLNLGDEAILASTLRQLRRARPDAEIVVFSRNPDHTRAHHDCDRVLCPREALRDEIEPEIRRLDLLLLGGGGILYDAEARTYLREVTMAQDVGVPTFAYAIGVGPLRSLEERIAVRDGLNRMAGVSVRELSAKHLLEEIGLRRPVTVTADPALLLEAELFPAEDLSARGVPADRPLVGMSVRERGGAAPGLEAMPYHDLLAATADFMVQRYGCDVLFVPMETADVREAHRVMSRMVQPDRAHLLPFGESPGRVLGLMSHLRLAVGMRLHFLIFAALAGVPLMPLPYASKVADLVLALGLPKGLATPRPETGLFLAELDRAWDDGTTLAVDPARLEALKDASRRNVPLALAAMRKDIGEPSPPHPA
ncbi:polysaccharide pyruvyl transferase family protein [Novispirillum sp. DQ9]|uniref:polysaccharide pyruvyl transferase family protein n=1 Tax=Novispirillum sp. DQ9 TaxID=3398612 RepID=UPI003C7D84DC